MPHRHLRLKGNLDDVEIVLDDERRFVSATSSGRQVNCRQTQLGVICDLPGGSSPGPGGGQGPALQLRVTPKRVFAKRFASQPSDEELADRVGFQRHSL